MINSRPPKLAVFWQVCQANSPPLQFLITSSHLNLTSPNCPKCCTEFEDFEEARVACVVQWPILGLSSKSTSLRAPPPPPSPNCFHYSLSLSLSSFHYSSSPTSTSSFQTVSTPPCRGRCPPSTPPPPSFQTVSTPPPANLREGLAVPIQPRLQETRSNSTATDLGLT